MKYYYHFNFHIVCKFIIIFIFINIQSALGQEVDPRIDRQAVTAWMAYEQFAQNLQGSITRTSTNHSTGKIRVLKYDYRKNALGASIRYIPLEGITDEERVWVQNRKYSFLLESKKPKIYQLIVCDFDLDKTLPLLDDSIHNTITKSLSSHYIFCTDWLWKILCTSSSIKVLQVGRISSSQGERYRIELKGEYALDSQTVNYVNGYLILDPSRMWCLERVEYKERSILKGKQSYELKRIIQYMTEMNSFGFPFLKRKVTTSEGYSYRLERKLHSIEDEVYEVEASEGNDESPFLMSAFGLPEPVGVVWEKRTPVYVWLFVAAGVLLTLGIFFRWLARRLRRGHSEG
jgi:hypothetical protein